MFHKMDSNSNSGEIMFAPILLSADDYKNGGIAARRREVANDLATHDLFYDDLYTALGPVVDYDDEVLNALEAANAETIMKGIKVFMEKSESVAIPCSDEKESVVALNALLVVDFEAIIRAVVGDARFEEFAAVG